MKFDWEQIYRTDGFVDSHTWRAKVIGGWIIRHQCWSDTADDGSAPVATSLVFLPDPNWDWVID